MTIRNLRYLFKPRSIAVVGEGNRPDGPDGLLVRNLIEAGFQGPVMPINPDRQALEGVLTYKDVASLPLVAELAVVTTPLHTAPALIGALGQHGTRAVILLSDPSLESHPDGGHALRQAMLNAARPYLLRIIGPDCLGVASPNHGVNAILSHTRPIPGHIALVSQSCAVARGVMDWATSHHIGFSHVISVGERIDVDFGDLLDYLAQDTQTRSVLLYLESVRHARKFMSAARIAARIKPALVLKPRDYRADPIEDAVYDAAFRRAGLLRVNAFDELFSAVETLASAKPVHNDRLAIVGNSRSVGLLASDMLLRVGGALAELSEATQAGLRAIVPPGLPIDNPVDLGERTGPDAYTKALEVLLKDPGAGGVLVLHAPTSPENDLACARAVIEQAQASRRFVLTNWVGADAAAPARRLFKEHQIATYDSTTVAALAFARVAQYRRNQELLMETPPSIPEAFVPDAEAARRVIAAALAAGRTRLNAVEASQVLSAYAIPVVETRFAHTPEEAAVQAEALGEAIALKVLSPDIRHKSDVGGVIFGVREPATVRKAAAAMLARVRAAAPEAAIDGLALQPMQRRGGAYELNLGVRTGRRFGPLLRFGHGGTETDVIDDIAYALPPLNMQLARELMSRTRIYARLSARRGRSANIDAIALTLIKVSQLAIDLAEIVELDINPLWTDTDGVMALDADIRIAAATRTGAERLAIRPYPQELAQSLELPDGRSLRLRPILPEDEPALQAMVRRLPAEDLRLRFFQPIKELSHAMAARLTQIDYDREMALVIASPDKPGEADIFGVVRITADPDMETAEYAILVDHDMAGMGLGPMLMRRIIDYARSRGIREIFGEVLRENETMLKLNRAFGFTIKPQAEDPGVMHVTLSLGAESRGEETT